MAHVKVAKNSPYFSRFQVKYKRRRQGKTDYRARTRLITQDKNKYNTPKYRFVVRFTKNDITCQVLYATLAGDICMAAAYAHELPKYGLTVGLTNYSAAYCVGLLCARRLLTKLGLADTYKGVEEATGEDYEVEEVDDGPRPFQCVLDAGLKRTSTGSKIFAAMKGACDGGLAIPHNEKRFVGYNKEDKKLDAEVLRKYIFGGHVAEYMESMKEDEPEKYERHFSQFVKAGVAADDLEDLYKKVHANIRGNPGHETKQRSKPADSKHFKAVKLTYDERKEALKKRLSALMEADDE